MSATLERLARNQVLFREVNERLLELSNGSSLDRFEFLCECSGEECAETVILSLDEYESVRTEPTAFLILPGHEIPEIERVVERNGRYAVVEKTTGETFAIETDPRASDAGNS
jgi:hypothetical protein